VSNADEKAETPKKAPESDAKPKRKRRWLRRIGVALGVLLVLLVAVRLAMPAGIKWYVNRVIDRDPLYDGRIGDIDVHLWRGAYTINDIRLNKVTGKRPGAALLRQTDGPGDPVGRAAARQGRRPGRDHRATAQLR
jgi:hypothetical protein